MDDRGILSQDEMDTVKHHLLRSKTKECQSCANPQILEIVNQVVAMRCAETTIEREVLFVSVKCSNCKAVRLYPASDLGISRESGATSA